jgi:hypothetical protein
VTSSSVAEPDPAGSDAFLTAPGYEMGKKSRSGFGIRDEDPGSYFRQLSENFLG